MKKIAITGNIGSGKTTVSQIIESAGYPVFYADDVAKSLYNKTHIQTSVVEVFGNAVCEDGAISLKKLASVVFSNPLEMKKLEAIIHPEVKKLFGEWVSLHKESNVVFMENAVLFEGGFDLLFDSIIVVSCPPDVRIQRIEKRDGLSRQQILDRMNMQIDEKVLMSRASYVIMNDGQRPLMPQIAKILKML